MSLPPPIPSDSLTPPPIPSAVAPPPVKVRRPLWKSWRAWLLTILIFIFGFLCLGAVLAKRTPNWYHPLDASDEMVRKVGEEFRHAVIGKHRNTLERVATGEPQTIIIKEDDLNAYLAVQYVAEEGSKRPFSKPCVVFSDGKITIAATANDVPGIGSGIISAQFHIDVFPPVDATKDPSTQATLTLDSVNIGDLPVPMWVAKEKIVKAIAALSPAVDAAVQAARRKETPESHVKEIREFLTKIANGEKVPVPHEYHGGLRGAQDARDVYLQSVVAETYQEGDRKTGRLKVTFWDQPLKAK